MVITVGDVPTRELIATMVSKSTQGILLQVHQFGGWIGPNVLTSLCTKANDTEQIRLRFQEVAQMIDRGYFKAEML